MRPQNQNEDIDIVHEREQGEQMLQQLNNDQRLIHDTIVNAITLAPISLWETYNDMLYVQES